MHQQWTCKSSVFCCAGYTPVEDLLLGIAHFRAAVLHNVCAPLAAVLEAILMLTYVVWVLQIGSSGYVGADVRATRLSCSDLMTPFASESRPMQA